MEIKSESNFDVPTYFWRFCRPQISIYMRNMKYYVESVEVFAYNLRKNRSIPPIKNAKYMKKY